MRPNNLHVAPGAGHLQSDTLRDLAPNRGSARLGLPDEQRLATGEPN